jgi:hypothetical protein
MAYDPLADFDEIITDKIFIGTDTNDLQEEIRQNTWWISLSQQQVEQLTPDDLREFINRIIDNRRQQVLTAQTDHGMYFYLWFDEMACQLRFSLISDVHEKLPFGCNVNQIATPDGIIGAFLSSPYHRGIPVTEFVEEPLNVTDVVESSSEIFTLDVYVVHLVKAK